jgi:hypothetical protein
MALQILRECDAEGCTWANSCRRCRSVARKAPTISASRSRRAPSEEFTGSQIGIKKGVWGESRFNFESIVEEVRRFVARMPPADSTTGLACCLRNFSALGDQRAEILPVQRPPTLAVGEHYMMRLARILIFPFLLSASWISCP